MLKKITFIVTVFMAISTSKAQELKIMTYNIRYGNETDGENAWSKRKDELVNLLDYYHPAVLGTQEGLNYQLEYIKGNLKGYTYIGVGRDNGGTEGEYSAVFYDTERLSIESSGTFWLSPTPEKPSKGWDAALNRICTYGVFKDKQTHKKFMVLNAHFDHVGEVARVEAAKLMLVKSRELNPKNYPIFVTGDFNLTPETKPIQVFSQQLHDSYTHTQTRPYGPVGTFNGYHFNEVPQNRIDYIFTSVTTKILNYRVIADFNNFRYPSDHLPVMITALLE